MKFDKQFGIFFGVWVGVFGFVNLAQAQDLAGVTAIMPTTTLPTLVVSATKSERVLEDAPVRVQVLSRETLLANHAHTLRQAIDLLPNVQLRQIHGKTGYEAVIQGLSGDRVLVLVDGLPVTASTGSTVNLNQYLNMDVEQIEVITGAASAQYGNAAMGGVINVITRPIKGYQAHASVEVGTNGSQNPSGSAIDANYQFAETSVEGVLDAKQQWRARLSASYLDDQGLSLDTDAWPRLKDSSRQTQINMRLNYLPRSDQDKANQAHKDDQYWLELSHYQEKDGQRFEYFRPPYYLPQQKEESIDKNRLVLGMKKNLPNQQGQNFKVQANALIENYQSDSQTFSRGALITDRQTDMDTALIQTQVDLPAWQSQSGDHNHFLQIGAQVQGDRLKQTNNGKSELDGDRVDRTVGEIYLQDDWFIGTDWELVTGLRYQNDSDFGGHFAPKITAKYRHTDKAGQDHLWRASIGSGYRVPNLKERYFVFDHSHLGYKVLGNPDLKPETSNSLQLGYEGSWGKSIKLYGNLFYNDLKDLITDQNPVGYDGNIALYGYANVDEAKTYGGELGMDWQIGKGKLHGDYVLTLSQNKRTKNPLSKTPKHKASLSLEYPLTEKSQAITRLNYESSQQITDGTKSPAWWRMDVKLNYRANDGLTLYTAINNLFDQQRDVNNTNDFTPIDNRQWLVGASYQWR